jgi:hypothetical protein
VAGGAADPDHNFVSGNEGGDERPAIGAPFLSHCKSRRQDGSARMRPRAGPGQAVEFECVGERAIGERRRRSLDR